MKNIVLIGMMGSGKSMIGKALAQTLGVAYYSTDAWVEHKAGQTIKQIVADQGWEHFRGLEHQAVQALADEKGVVIDCGGGVVLDPRNLEVFKKRGIIFYLQAPLEVLYGRLKNDRNRPLLQAADPLAVLERIYNERFPLYSQADFTIDASAPSIEGPVAQILEKVK